MISINSDDIRETILKIFRFAIPQILSAISSLFAISVLNKNFSGEIFAGYAIGQSLGTFSGLFINWGWPTIGASLVSSATDIKRHEYLFCFFKMATLLFCVFIPLFAFLAWQVSTNAQKIIVLVSFFAAVITAFLPTWWFIACNLPYNIMVFDIFPRAISNFISAELMQNGAPSYTFPLANMIVSIVGSAIFIFRKKIWIYKTEIPVLSMIKKQIHPFFISIGVVVHSRLMLPIVQIINPVIAISFSQGFMLYNYWTVSTAVTGSSFQNWVNRGGKKTLEDSFVFTLAWLTCHGFIFGFLLWIVGPSVAKLIINELGDNTSMSYFLLGLSFFFVSLGTALITLYLTPLGYAKISSQITIYSGIFGLIILCFLTYIFGLNGAYAAFTISELLIVLMAIIFVLRHKRRVGSTL